MLAARVEPCKLRLLSPLSKDRRLAIDVPLSPGLTLVCLSIVELAIDVVLVDYIPQDMARAENKFRLCSAMCPVYKKPYYGRMERCK